MVEHGAGDRLGGQVRGGDRHQPVRSGEAIRWRRGPRRRAGRAAGALGDAEGVAEADELHLAVRVALLAGLGRVSASISRRRTAASCDWAEVATTATRVGSGVFAWRHDDEQHLGVPPHASVDRTGGRPRGAAGSARRGQLPVPPGLLDREGARPATSVRRGAGRPGLAARRRVPHATPSSSPARGRGGLPPGLRRRPAPRVLPHAWPTTSRCRGHAGQVAATTAFPHPLKIARLGVPRPLRGVDAPAPGLPQQPGDTGRSPPRGSRSATARSTSAAWPCCGARTATGVLPLDRHIGARQPPGGRSPTRCPRTALGHHRLRSRATSSSSPRSRSTPRSTTPASSTCACRSTSATSSRARRSPRSCSSPTSSGRPGTEIYAGW